MSEQNNDWSLVAQIKEGDERAFDAIMERYKRPVMGFVYRMIGDAVEAEDVAQDVFLRAYQAIRKPGFHQVTAQFSSWLFQVARHAALDYQRKKRRHPALSLAVMEAGGNTVVSPGKTAREQVADNEVGESIAAAVARLPEDQRTAIILSEYEGFSDVEIGEVLKCTRKSVEARLYRARRFLRKVLVRHLG